MRVFCLFLTIFFGLGLISNGQLINIPSDYQSIQDGIEAAGYGDTVLVADGMYIENINFKGKAITVASHFIIDRDTSHISKTVIDGSRPVHPDTASTILMVSGEDTTSILCGFTITGGSGTLIQVAKRLIWRTGGGIFIVESGGKISNNYIQGNQIDHDNEHVIMGGGLFVFLSEKSKDILICENIIRNNTIESKRQLAGAGISINYTNGNGNSKILIENNLITHNKAIITGNRERAHGGGITLSLLLPASSDIIIRNNEISFNKLLGNRTVGAGIDIIYREPGGRFTDLHPCPVIYKNIISNNSSQDIGGGFRIQTNRNQYSHSLLSPQPLIINNEIIHNSASDASGFYIQRSSPFLLGNYYLSDSLNSEGEEVLIDERSYLYMSKNDLDVKLRYKRVWRLLNNYYLRTEKTYLKFTWTNSLGTPMVTVLPPLWRTGWALIGYGLIVMLIFILYRRFLLNRAKLRTALEVERIEKEKAQEFNRMKSRFFANISHEFRTPLTLLLGPINDLLKRKPGKDEFDWNLLRLMQSNASRLQRLINQLLDLSKLETGKLNLQVAKGNLTEFMRRIVLSFLSLAESTNIIYKYDLPEIPGQVYFDGDKLEKILTNLISNAFKFTPEEGWIRVTMNYLPSEGNDPPEMVEISVRDSGKGISKDQIDKIFDRFYMVSDSDTRETEGTGIGLSLTKELIELYRGEIHVDSKLGKGSVFTVKLPVSRKHFNEDEIVAALKENQDRHELYDTEAGFIGPDDSEMQEDRMTKQDVSIVLIVEDNIDLRKYIAHNLDDSFQILQAENGKTGLDKAIETIPDLVISDLMMPEMDGMEMCKRLKSDERTSHIPVIMLTAKADRESKLEGLETGADDYIIKPFDAEELHIKVNNLITQRRRLREKYRKEFLTGGKDIELLPYDEQFLSKVSEAVLDHLQDSEFNIESLCREIGMSRSQLYKKVLAITGFTPTEYLRNIRLKQAAHMLREKVYNITQVAYNVGFSNPSYFSECFRRLYGSTPSEYIKKN